MYKLLLKLSCVLVLLLSSFYLQAQERYTISGYVEDIDNSEKLIAATVYVVGETKGTNTNVYGFYSLTLPADSVYLAVSYVGYQTQYFRIDLKEDVTLNIQMGVESMEVVEVSAERQDRIEDKTQMSEVSIPIQQIKKLPALLGEVDVLKTLQLMPGVQSGGEGTSGLYVRGGSPDQVLMLLDGAPVYNASHLFGFFSVFNADAINNISLIKGGFPARYGGRLSSVLEINMKEGNMKKFKANGTIGLLASKLTLEGPIVKDKTSFLISGRRTYIDLLAQPFIKASQNDEDFSVSGGYYFYDGNIKLNHKFSDKDRLYLSFYGGNDKFYADTEEKYQDFESEYGFGLDWGNLTGTLRYNHMFSNKLFSNIAMTYSRYQFDTGLNIAEKDLIREEEIQWIAKYKSGIEDYAGKVDFDFVPNPSHYVKFGASATHHTFRPGAINFKLDTDNQTELDTTVGSVNVGSWDMTAYVEDDLSIGKNFKANIGVHFSTFLVEKEPYYSVQPRLGMKYMLPKSYALKASFATMYQYLHLLTNEGIGLPTDLWLPSTKQIKPESSWQAALGVAKTFDDKFEVSVEGYYKEMKNLISYKEGANFFGFGDWQDKVEIGEGYSYGVEVFAQKKFGKTTGWAGYTLSWSNRKFNNINGEEWYPFKYDRRHDISLVFMHEFGPKIQISATWVYGTGNAITLPEYSYFTAYPSDYWNEPGVIGGETTSSPKSKNSFRMNSYHRADIGVDFVKKKKRYERKFTIGFYNLYNRRNPFFIYETYDFNTDQDVFKQLSLFPILPSFSYSFKF